MQLALADLPTPSPLVKADIRSLTSLSPEERQRGLAKISQVVCPFEFQCMKRPIAEGPSKSRTSCTARCIATTFPRRGGSIRDALTLDRILGQVLAALEALKAPRKGVSKGQAVMRM